MHNHYSIIAFFCILFPLFISVKNFKRNNKVKFLFLFLLELLIYMFGESQWAGNTNYSSALFWDKFMYLGIVFTPASILGLVIAQTQERLATNKILIFMLFFPCFLFAVLLPTDLFLSDMEPLPWGWGKVVGPAYAYFKIYFLLCLSVSIILMIRGYIKSTNPREKNELKWWILSIVPALLSGILVINILSAFGYKNLNVGFNAIFIIIMSCSLTYAITKKNLLDIDLLISKLPIIKTQKYRFHQDIKGLIDEMNTINSLDALIGRLSKLFRCPVSIMTTKNDFDNKIDYEFIMPFMVNNQAIFLGFGNGFSSIVYSSQDIRLLSVMKRYLSFVLTYLFVCKNELEQKDRIIARYQQRVKNLSMPPLIAMNEGNILGVWTAEEQEYCIFDVKSDDLIKIFKTKRYPEKPFNSLLDS